MLTNIILPVVLLTVLLLVLLLLAFVVQELVTTKRHNLNTQKLYQENIEELECLIRRLEEKLPLVENLTKVKPVKTPEGDRNKLKIVTNKN